MAWLSGITGKAEELLNKIDQNAALALKKEKLHKKVITDENLTEVMTQGSDLRDPCMSSKQQQNTNSQSVLSSVVINTSFSQPLKSSPSHQQSMVKSNSNNKLQKLQDNEEQLIEFLNNSNSTVIVNDNEVSVKENDINYNGCIKDKDISNTESSKNVDNIDSNNQDFALLDKENQMLKNEVRTVNNEMSLLLHRTKAAEKESEKLKQDLQESQSRISRLQADLQGVRLQLASDDERLRNLQSENERLTTSLSAQTESTTHANIEMSTAMEDLKQRLLDAQLKENTITTELTSLTDRLRISDEEKLRIDNIKKDLESQYQVMVQRLTETTTEFEQYRTRAQRTLSNKEQLIAELRKSSSDSSNDKLIEMELQQLREERGALNEECQQMSNRLEIISGELANAERKLESVKEEAAATQYKLQESLLQEQRRREVAEEDCRAQTEELHSIREELSRQRTQLTSRLRERESELTRLRSQLTQRPASPPQVPAELEARLSALTSSLVQKQANVEVLASEKNALRLQLEKTEYKYREAIKLLNQIQGRTINVNDTDDAKAQVPSFLIESPFDTGVTRRVKRAYSSLDAVGIRTSVFLRRYPLARILIMFYVVFLHLWVILVLFSYSPDSSTVNL
ncbi:golgin subfamily A member 5-like [Lycorma delicatula]|uniref:golgin subfamily A member 5-like n=1 Tax=Lycorma delicatula TaxID=130591 RepID=UPI003F5150CE